MWEPFVEGASIQPRSAVNVPRGLERLGVSAPVGSASPRLTSFSAGTHHGARPRPIRSTKGGVAMRRLGIVIAVGLIVGTGAMATPASASFPGTDGRIGFGSDRYGHTHNIFTMNPDGSDVRQLTFLTSDQGAALNENWSPDGTQLVFEQRNPDGSV